MRMVGAIGFAACVILAPGAASATIIDCGAVHDLSKKLTCFEKQRTSPMGGWFVQSERDPLNDTQTVSVAENAEQGTNNIGTPVTLVLRCKRSTPEVYIMWREFLGDTGLYVKYRIDKGVIQGGGWLASNDSTATFYANPKGMIKDLLGGSKFVVRTVPYESNTITAIFDLSGLQESISPLLKACDLSL